MRDDEPVGVGLPALFIPQLRPSGQALYPILTEAPSASPIVTPTSSLRRVLPVAPKKAWWSLTAFAISCPTCPKKVVSKVGPLPFTIGQITSLAAGYKKSGVQLEIRRQRRADEPDAGAWYRTFWPQGDVGTLESLGGTKV